MVSIWLMRDLRLMVMPVNTAAAMNMKPAAEPNKMSICFLCSFINFSRVVVVVFKFSPALTAKLAERVANSADSKATNLTPSNSSLSACKASSAALIAAAVAATDAAAAAVAEAVPVTAAVSLATGLVSLGRP